MKGVAGISSAAELVGVAQLNSAESVPEISPAAQPVGEVSAKEHILESQASKQSKKEHDLVDQETLLIVEDVLSMERLRFVDLLIGAIGFHVRGTD